MSSALSTPVARAAPDDDAAAALVIDVARVVTTAEGSGWFIDADEYAELYPTLLESVCRASAGARALALERLRADARQHGEPEAVFAAEGQRVTSRFEAALSAARRARAFENAARGAGADCPFWIPASSRFRGRQTDRHRFTLGVETGGNLQIRQTAGRWTFGGGGLGRLLPSYGVSDHLSILFGVEFGGGAMLRPGGGPSTDFVVNYFPALPLVFRFRDVNWRYDVELGPVALFQADNTRLSYGGRIGTAVGLMGLRTRNVLPWAGVAATYEYYFEGGGRPAAHFLRGGLRVGITWDPAF